MKKKNQKNAVITYIYIFVIQLISIAGQQFTTNPQFLNHFSGWNKKNFRIKSWNPKRRMYF